MPIVTITALPAPTGQTGNSGDYITGPSVPDDLPYDALIRKWVAQRVLRLKWCNDAKHDYSNLAVPLSNNMDETGTEIRRLMLRENCASIGITL